MIVISHLQGAGGRALMPVSAGMARPGKLKPIKAPPSPSPPLGGAAGAETKLGHSPTKTFTGGAFTFVVCPAAQV